MRNGLHQRYAVGVTEPLYRDRREAGQALAALLAHYRGHDDVVVLALPRGGVPVGYEVAEALGAPLDVFIVRKLGIPGHEELAMGALATGGVVVLNDDVVRGMQIPPEVIEQVATQEGRELERRERAYREDAPPIDVTGKVAILVDDGLATGSSMRAAILALRRRGPARIVVAVPAAPDSTCQELAAEVDEVVCATTPSPFLAVGQHYWNFAQVTDDEVRDLLRQARSSPRVRASGNGQAGPSVLRSVLAPLDEGVQDRQALLDLVGDAHFVLLGEASHGTHEFYEARARMTRWLIEEKGFCAVAVEGDWPDAYRVNRYVRARGDDGDAEEALRDFERFPTWMWRNSVVLDFVGWLRQHNDRLGRDEEAKVGFYGLDLYSLFRSIQEVISYLERVDPLAAARARERYSCFDHYRGEAQDYGFAAAFGAGESCEQQVVDQLVELHRHGADYAGSGDVIAADELFYAEQNARTVQNAEEYYRSMFGDRASSWNLRDEHMVDTLDALVGHLSQQRGEPAKVVVWAHNSHVGDARATEVSGQGQLTVGQLVRERHAGDCRLIGFSTFTGTVTAADDWGGAAERKRVRPALRDSTERLLHDTDDKAFWIAFGQAPEATELLRSPRLERAIGVIYRPRTERQSHYFHARLADQFDAVIHIDETRAVEPLERSARWEEGEVPETFPHAV
ncbi:MAG: Erythromycin esterase [Acidimicrobiales bacterium]|nr:Erythromycin esterase [Acidimicrobiales bacterium]